MDERLSEQYRRRFDGEAEARNRVWRVLIDRWFSRYLLGAEAVLDLGCGWGQFINQIDVPQRFALDLNPDADEHLDRGVTLFRQPAEEPWPIPPGSLDLVFTSNFLEHVPDRDALLSALGHAYEALKPGGLIVCLGPNVRKVPGAYWDFFDHMIPLSERSLAEALALAGFEVEEAIGAFLPYTMAGKPPPPSVAIRAYLRLRPAWRVLGGQFLVVGRRR